MKGDYQMKEKFYEVTRAGIGNYYDSMVGKCVFETAKTYVLEFKLNDSLGGLQRVTFFKHQVEEYDMSQT